MGILNFYSDQIWTNYTPGYLYILSLLGFIKNLFSINDTFFYLILKLPSIIAEIYLAFFIYQQIVKKSLFWARITAIAILLNPALIFNSSIWGQVDGILTLFIFISIYFLYNNQLIFSAIFIAISFLIKPQAIAVLPVFAFFTISNLRFSTFFKFLLPFSTTLFVFSLPFFGKNLLGFPQLFFKMTSDYPQTSLFAYNLWGVVGFWIADNVKWGILSYQQWGYLLYGAYWVILTHLYFRKKISLVPLTTLALLSFYFLPTRIHERYLYPAITFLFLFAALKKSLGLFLLTTLLSTVHFLNLYYVYVYYNELFLKSPRILYNPMLYNLLDSHGKTLSFISTVIFLLISIMILKANYVTTKKT